MTKPCREYVAEEMKGENAALIAGSCAEGEVEARVRARFGTVRPPSESGT